MAQPLWQPSPEQIAKTNMTAFARKLESEWGISLPDYAALHRFSVEEMEKFVTSLWDFCGVIAETRGDTVIENPGKMPGARFFPQARLNFAENLLRRRDGSDAIVFWGEDKVRRRLSWRELHGEVSRLAQAMRAQGIKPGDRVAGWLPNMPETIIAMLAATSLGAVWSSSSPDFGLLRLAPIIRSRSGSKPSTYFHPAETIAAHARRKSSGRTNRSSSAA